MDIYDLYDEASEIQDPARCEEFLASHCGGDESLLQRLLAMLAVRGDADRLLEWQLPATSLASASPDVSLGQLGRFRLERLIGRGGMENVFLAHDTELDRPVAIKFPRIGSGAEASLRDRLLREARLAAKLHHPNLVEVFEAGLWGDACYIASRWCDGGDLENWLLQHPGPQDPIWSARMIRAIASAVSYCHGQNVLHLDIKPANIMLEAVSGDDGCQSLPSFTPKLTDSGVARVIEEGHLSTHTSLLLGTPLYMAPEQAESDQAKIGPASDNFSLGVVLYQLVIGSRPFEGKTPIQVIDQLRRADTLVIPRLRTVPQDLLTICQRCLQLEPSARYATAQQLVEDLDRFLRGEPILAKPVTGWTRLWRWMERPERISQAGTIGLSIQSLYILAFTAVIVVHALGWSSAMSHVSVSSTIADVVPIIGLLQLPVAFVLWQTVKRRLWSVPVAIVLSGISMTVLAYIVVTGNSSMRMYQGQPLATYLQHLLSLTGIAIQTLALVIAIPAALRARRRGNDFAGSDRLAG